MKPSTQEEKAGGLAALHHGPRILVLPNAWDCASARLFELAGFPAIATTSAGIAFSLGYPDGERISRDEMLASVKRIVAAVAVPVTADMEAGYGETPEQVAETARAVLLYAGAVGMNLEDSSALAPAALTDVTLQVEKINSIREMAGAAGIPMVLNARTDVFLNQVGAPAARLGEAIRRANAYRDAGADCLFVPGVTDRETIGRLVREIHGPLNILAAAGGPSVAELKALGVARVSVGSGPMRATMALTQRIAKELMESGTYTCYTAATISHSDVNRIFARKARGRPRKR